MKEFPQELVDQVCGYLTREDLLSVQDVSTSFRRAAEQSGWKYRYDQVTLTQEDDPEKFINDYSGFRLHFLSEIQFNVHFGVLREHDVWGARENCEDEEDEEGGYQDPCLESLQEKHEKDVSFTQQVKWIFNVLKQIETRTRQDIRGAIRLNISTLPHEDGRCRHRDHAQWRTHLLDTDSLPYLKSVISLDVVNTDSSIKLDYSAQIHLAKHLPNLEFISCYSGQGEWTEWHASKPKCDYFWDWSGPRRDARHEYAKTISSGDMPKALQEAELNFICEDAVRNANYSNHWLTMPNLVSPLSTDPFSNSLRILSYNLRRLVLRAQVDETLFWPTDGTVPHWPHLEYLYLMFHMIAPSGAYYFEGPRGEGRHTVGYELNETSYPVGEAPDTDYRPPWGWSCAEDFGGSCDAADTFSFRISPNEAVLVPLLTDFARAAECMPRLKRAILWSPLKFEFTFDDNAGSEGDLDESAFDYFYPPSAFHPDYEFAWGFVYEAPRSSDPPVNTWHNEYEDHQTRRLYWSTGPWRADEELHAKFRQIGRREHGDVIHETWNEADCTMGFTHRYFFDEYTSQGEHEPFWAQDQKINESLMRCKEHSYS